MDGLLSLAAVFALTICAWASFIPIVAYRKYQSLAHQNAELLGKGNGNPYAIKPNNEYASMVNAFVAFEGLKGENGLQKDRCDIMITAPEENKQVAGILRGIASGAHCSIEEIMPLGGDSTEGFPAVDGKVVVHAEQGTRGESFAQSLGNAFNVKLSHEMPPGRPPGFVWIQVGTGVVWRTTN